MDSSGDHRISAREFRRAVLETTEAAGARVSAEECAALFESFDEDNSGEISYKELAAALQPSTAALNRKALRGSSRLPAKPRRAAADASAAPSRAPAAQHTQHTPPRQASHAQHEESSHLGDLGGDLGDLGGNLGDLGAREEESSHLATPPAAANRAALRERPVAHTPVDLESSAMREGSGKVQGRFRDIESSAAATGTGTPARGSVHPPRSLATQPGFDAALDERDSADATPSPS